MNTMWFTHRPQSAAADGKPGPQTTPVRTRTANSRIQLTRAATGARSVKTPARKTPPPRIHLVPSFSAKYPATDYIAMNIHLPSRRHLLFWKRSNNYEIGGVFERILLQLTGDVSIEESAEKKSLLWRIPVELVFLINSHTCITRKQCSRQNATVGVVDPAEGAEQDFPDWFWSLGGAAWKRASSRLSVTPFKRYEPLLR